MIVSKDKHRCINAVHTLEKKKVSTVFYIIAVRAASGSELFHSDEATALRVSPAELPS